MKRGTGEEKIRILGSLEEAKGVLAFSNEGVGPEPGELAVRIDRA